jgi:hypothetical protein
MPLFLTDDELRTRAGGVFREGAENVDPDWLTAAITDCNQQSADYLGGSLAERGFTQTQILSWAGGKAAQISLALFFISARARLDGLADRGGVAFLNLIDPRPGLSDLTLTDAAGKAILPTSGGVGFSTGPKDRFGRPVRGDRAFDRHHGGFIRW